MSGVSPFDNSEFGPTKRPRLSVGKKLLFALVPLLALTAATELGFRLFPHQDRGTTIGGMTKPDPDLIWKLKAQATGPLATNELGFRDGPYRADADIKILLLGDSVAWADGIRDQKLGFATVLEERLGRAYPQRRFEVINSGVPGYSTFQQVRYLAHDGLALDPDLIILQFCLNDVTTRYLNVMAYGGDNVFMGIDTRQSVPGVIGFLVRHSRAVEGICRLIQQQGRKQETYQVEKLAVDQLSTALEKAWTLVEEELTEIHRLAVAREIPLLLMIAPYRFQVEDANLWRQPQDRLLTWAAAHDVAVVDLLPGFADAPEDDDLFNPNDQNHFSVYGHFRAAQLLLQSTLDLLTAHVFPEG